MCESHVRCLSLHSQAFKQDKHSLSLTGAPQPDWDPKDLLGAAQTDWDPLRPIGAPQIHWEPLRPTGILSDRLGPRRYTESHLYRLGPCIPIGAPQTYLEPPTPAEVSRTNWGPADLLGDAKTDWSPADLLGVAKTDWESFRPIVDPRCTGTAQILWGPAHQLGAPRVWDGLDQSAGFIIQSSPGRFGLDWIRYLSTKLILDWTGSRHVHCAMCNPHLEI